MAIATEELMQAGLCDGSDEYHLTAKGRDWLRALEEMQQRESLRDVEASEDFVLSTSGIFR